MSKSKKENTKGMTIDELLKSVNKEFGDGTAIHLDDVKVHDVPAISTGTISLDKALGVGGLPRGRIVEIFGPESSGKTTLALNVVAQAQKAGGHCAYIDVEHSIDPDYSKKIGIDTKKFIFSQPNSGEEALNLLQRYVESGALSVVVLDSVAALAPMAEVEGDVGNMQMGLQARMMSQSLRKLTAVVSKTKTLVIFINQLRMKIGGMQWGNPETTPGGVALKYYSSVRIDIRKIQTLKDKEAIIGGNVRAKIVKNKVAPPFKIAEFVMLFGEGIDRAADILNTGISYGIISKTGITYSYGKIKLGVGQNDAKETLRNDAKLSEEIASEILKAESKVDVEEDVLE